MEKWIMLSNEKEKYLEARDKVELEDLSEEENFALLVMNDAIRADSTLRMMSFGLTTMFSYYMAEEKEKELIKPRLEKIRKLVEEGTRIIKNEEKANASYASNS